MKQSNYNFSFPLEESEKQIFYNSMTNSLALLENDKYKIYKEYMDDNIDNLKSVDSKLYEDLKMGGFIIDNDYDELKELRCRLLNARFSSDSLGLTLAPTSDCNFRCVYCYEKDVIKPIYMSEQVQESIIKYVEQYKERIHSLSLTWYGGEPLMAVEIIENISSKLIKFCDDNNIRYSAGIITNGFLLAREIVDKLNRLKVSFYQITLDGSRETHNKRRFLTNKEGTFDKIISNIKDCYDLLPFVSLRVNIDKTNKESIYDIMKLVEENNLSEKVKPYLGKVTNDNDCHMDSMCFTTKEFGEIDLDYVIKYANKIDWNSKYPSSRSNFCGADCNNSCVINSDGLVYKCWNDIGYEEKAIGNMVSGDRLNPQVYYNYMLYDVTENERCSKCKMLPICMGGCPNNRLKGNSEDNCVVYKGKLHNYIDFVTSKILEEKNK